MEKPLRAEADQDLLDDLAGLLSKLRAERFVADMAEPDQGLDYPALEVKAFYAVASNEEGTGAKKAGGKDEPSGERSHLLEIGASAEGGRHARLDSSDAVFVVSERLGRLLSGPLISRALLSTPEERIESLKLTGRERTVEVTRRGDGFSMIGAGPDASEDAASLAKSIAGLRAAGAAYGDPTPDQGLEAPVTRVAVVRKKGSSEPLSYQVLVGAEAPPGPDAKPARYVKRADLAVVFTVPAADLAPFLEKVN